MPNTFVALDVETANSDPDSICQIGMAWFVDSQVTGTYLTYVDPQSWFDDINISIHGITPEMVTGAPTIREVFTTLKTHLAENIIVHHTPFDRLSLTRASENNSITLPVIRWLDSARVVRRVYPQYRASGYGLSNLAANFEITYKAHDALEDARAAGLVLIKAIQESGVGLVEWETKAYKRISHSHEIKLDGNPDGLFYGETIVFTGALSITRSEASKLAAEVGCTVDDKVNKQTTILVVGDQDLSRLAGNEKSSKHRKAESLLQSGHPIRIIRETDFLAIINY